MVCLLRLAWIDTLLGSISLSLSVCVCVCVYVCLSSCPQGFSLAILGGCFEVSKKSLRYGAG